MASCRHGKPDEPSHALGAGPSFGTGCVLSRRARAVAGLAVWGFCCWGAPRATWHHSRSPYRAVFEITTQPNHPEAGLAASVPVCGLGLPEGGDLVAYDDRNAQLPLVSLGNGPKNDAIALVRPGADTARVYVYFGSGTRGPTHRNAALQSLTVDIRTVPEGPYTSWPSVEVLVKKSKRIGRQFVDTIALGYNPVSSADAFLMVFDGYLNIPKAGEYTYMLVSDDAGYLFVDDKLLISRNGRQWAANALRGESRASVELSAGAHRIRCVVVEAGGTQMALVGRWITGKQKYALRPGDFVQPGKTKLVEVEPRYGKSPCPCFWYEPRSYMSYRGAQYTEVEFGTFTGENASWSFGDGAVAKGPTLSRVLPGLSSGEVTVRHGRAEAEGRIHLPELPPKQREMEDAASFKHYTSLILNQDLREIDVSTLRGYITFLNYRELNEDAVPVYEAILAGKKVDPGHRWDANLGLARAAARSSPDTSLAAYRALFDDRRSAPKDVWPSVAREYAEFLLFRVRDIKVAGSVIEKLSRLSEGDDKAVLSLQLDLALQEDDTEAARRYMDRLMGGRDVGKNQRLAAVKGNALRERFYDLVGSGFIEDAVGVLHEWEGLSPEDRTNGSFSLARARLWKRLGWYDGALADLDGAVLMNPLLPNLPDVEMERGLVCLEAGDGPKAKEIFRRIREQYPNHPAAREAEGLLK